MQDQHLPVTLEAIPYSCTEQAFNRLGPLEAKYREDIITAFNKFNMVEINYLHLDSVNKSKESLAQLIDACRRYQRNLGW